MRWRVSNWEGETLKPGAPSVTKPPVCSPWWGTDLRDAVPEATLLPQTPGLWSISERVPETEGRQYILCLVAQFALSPNQVPRAIKRLVAVRLLEARCALVIPGKGSAHRLSPSFQHHGLAAAGGYDVDLATPEARAPELN